jgi:predicted acylesterase/phospholipase RssA
MREGDTMNTTRRALVLNAGLAWGAYQVGALRHLVRDRNLSFELCAGSGIGAMNAALVACGALDALEAFWERIGPLRLLAPNVQNPLEGPMSSLPQRKFMQKYVSESRLATLRTKLLVNVFNLQSGQEEILEYPGADLPLIDALTAAVATPGLCPPVKHRGEQLVEGTFIHGFLLEAVAQRELDEIYAIAACLPEQETDVRLYPHVRAVLERSVAMNQAHDVREGFASARDITACIEAYAKVNKLPDALAAQVDDPALREQVLARAREVLERSRFPLKRGRTPVTHAITPSKRLDYPLWRFRRRELSAAQALGYADARRALPLGGLS